MAFKDEFISRDPQLPAQGDIGASDMRQASDSRDAQQLAPLGSPPADYDVRSVYDSRPVSGGDFNVILTFPAGACITPAPVFFVVPQGYVAVLRELETWCEPILSLTTRADITVSPQINLSDIQYNNNIPVGNGTLENIKLFAIADELQKVGVIFPVFPATPGITLYAQVYGNLLLKTGRPAQFEIANYAGKGHGPGMPQPSAPPQRLMMGTAPVASPRPLPPPPPPPPSQRVYIPEAPQRPKGRGMFRGVDTTRGRK